MLLIPEPHPDFLEEKKERPEWNCEGKQCPATQEEIIIAYRYLEQPGSCSKHLTCVNAIHFSWWCYEVGDILPVPKAQRVSVPCLWSLVIQLW